MILRELTRLKLALDDHWYKEYWTFLMVPLLATLACYFIPIFHCDQGLTYMAVMPLTAAFSYGHILSPRRPYYEEGWQKIMDYPTFILSSVKKILLFAIPTGITGRITSWFLTGYLQELAMFFETAVWMLSSAICLHALLAYAEETSKLKKTNAECYRARLADLWKWVVPPAIAFSSLVILKGYLLFDLLKGRP